MMTDWAVATGPGSHRQAPTSPWSQPWSEQALCRQVDPRIFFPIKRRGSGTTGEAKRTCYACSVRAECLEYALTWNERHGIWGGLTVNERRKLARERDAA